MSRRIRIDLYRNLLQKDDLRRGSRGSEKAQGDIQDARERPDAGSDSTRRDARDAQEQLEVQADSERRDAQERFDAGSDSDRRDARDAREQFELKADSEHRDARGAQEQFEVQADSERRDAQERFHAGSTGERRDAKEQFEVQADSERRDARDAQEQFEVQADSERRDARDAQEQFEVQADSERRDARDAQARFDSGVDRDRRAADDRKQRLQAQLQQAQRLENLGQLAGGVAHDFNNLLAVILNYASFVSEELADPTGLDWLSHVESARNDVEQIKLAAERAASLTRQLLSFARQEVIRPRVIDLNHVISGVEDMLRRTIGEHVELATALGRDLWPILADPGQLEQVLVNLAVNARDAMPEGGILTIDSDNITVDADSIAGGSKASLGRNVRLRVSDTGTGMPHHVAEHVFEPFFTTKELGAGTGLGLATVYGIVVQAEGSIHIYSEPGMGTTFSIIFPVTAEVASPVTPSIPERHAAQGGTVLVVEDEQALREVTRRILSRNGFDVITAANGPEALDRIRTYPGEIDLLVTDVVMPQMLGKEVAERIRALKPNVDVLFMSGYARPVLTSQGRLAPDVALVEKPFSESELLTMVGKVLRGDFPGFKTVAATRS